jgi:hypothetical protein
VAKVIIETNLLNKAVDTKKYSCGALLMRGNTGGQGDMFALCSSCVS